MKSTFDSSMNILKYSIASEPARYIGTDFDRSFSSCNFFNFKRTCSVLSQAITGETTVLFSLRRERSVSSYV